MQSDQKSNRIFRGRDFLQVILIGIRFVAAILMTSHILTEDRLKQNVLGKEEVFYGGQIFSGKIVAPPASKVILKIIYLCKKAS